MTDSIEATRTVSLNELITGIEVSFSIVFTNANITSPFPLTKKISSSKLIAEQSKRKSSSRYMDTSTLLFRYFRSHYSGGQSAQVIMNKLFINLQYLFYGKL